MRPRPRHTLPLATALLALAGAAGCGGGSDPPATTARTTTAAAVTEPGAGTEAHNTAPPAKLTKRRVTAATFTVPLPVGYRDASHDKALKDAPVKPDLVLTGRRVGGVVTNVNVVRVEAPKVTLQQLVDAERRQRAMQGARFRGANTKVSLDGEPAASFAFQAPPAQGPFLQRQVFALRGGREVVVTLTASDKAFDAGERVLEAVVAGWRWR